MINFFRKKRKNLADDNPPTSRAGKAVKYASYAIGEIVLVVIGILIALQINNWNQSRLQHKDELYILEQFLVALNNDVHQLEDIILSTTSRRKKVDTIIKILESPSNKQLMQFIQLQSALTTDNYFKASQGTFQEAISLGKLKLIRNNSLREQIYNYYDNISDDKSNDFSSYKLTNEFILPILVEEIGSTKQVAELYLEANNNLLPDLDLMKLAKNKKYYQAIIYSKEDIYQLHDWIHYKKMALNLIHNIEVELELLKI